MSATKSTLVRTAAAVLLAAASSAWAQDYTVTVATGLLETRPASATPYSITSGGVGTFATASLPFSFPYYGTIVTDVTITPDGFALLRAVGSIPSANNPNAGHGQNGSAFPYSQTGAGGAGTQNVDGLVAAAWSNQFRVNEAPYGGMVYTWTSGASPSRHFVISWDNAKFGTNTNAPFTMQIQLFEGTGRIVLAYSTTGVYSTAYVCGIDSPVDARFTAPLSTGVSNSGYPGGDFVLDPRAATFTGTVLYDKTTSDETGVGNTIQSSRPLAKLDVELRSGGVLAARTTTAPDGSYSVTGLGLPATPSGSIAVLSQSAGCRVSTGTGVATEWTAVSSLSLAAGASLGVQTLGVGADPGGDVRGAMNVAIDCGAGYDWASARTATSIPRVEAYLDPTSTGATVFQKETGPAAAYLRIASRIAPDPDMWDDAVVTKVYARYVLSILAGVPVSAYDDKFDAVTDAQNAFAEGFGHYVWAVVSGATRSIDGTGASTASVYDLETPAVASPKSDAVAGCVAGALYDLQDAANETTDPVDGRSTQDRVFLAADALSVAPTAATFLQAWIDAGYDAPGATRVFVANGVLSDDALEPNDSIAETAPMGEVGFVRPALVLNRFDEDWFSVTLAADAPSIAADAKYDASGTGATVALEIRDAGGTSLATGTLVPATGAVHAATGPVTAGTYRIGVRHVSGPTVPSYVFQAYQPMSMPSAPIADWTLGRAYDRPLGVVGGIPPFTATSQGPPLPPGLGLNSTTLHAVGVPNVVGTTQITIEVKDGGSPANVTTRSQTLVIHDVLRLPGRAFLGFPAGVAVDLDLPTTGGTPPFTLTTTSGSLPTGLSFAPNSLHVAGTASAQPSTALELDGVDVAGSADHVATRAVVAAHVAAKNTPTQLAAGVDACGWWFDAVLGSTVSFSVNTAKKNAKRALDARLLAPDASAVATGTIKDTYGTIRASKLVCPSSGRYYFIADSQDSGAATQLLGTLGVALPKSGKGSSKSFAPTDQATIVFGAVPGSTATVKFAGDKKAGLVAEVVSVLDPTGTQVPFASYVKPTAVGGTMTLPLPVGGTWTVVLGATSTTDTAGKYSYSYSIKQKKGSVYVAE